MEIDLQLNFNFISKVLFCIYDIRITNLSEGAGRRQSKVVCRLCKTFLQFYPKLVFCPRQCSYLLEPDDCVLIDACLMLFWCQQHCFEGGEVLVKLADIVHIFSIFFCFLSKIVGPNKNSKLTLHYSYIQLLKTV